MLTTAVTATTRLAMSQPSNCITRTMEKSAFLSRSSPTSPLGQPGIPSGFVHHRPARSSSRLAVTINQRTKRLISPDNRESRGWFMLHLLCRATGNYPPTLLTLSVRQPHLCKFISRAVRAPCFASLSVLLRTGINITPLFMRKGWVGQSVCKQSSLE